MQNVIDIINQAGGRREVSRALGITPDAVALAEKSGKLPAMWFDALERRVGCPLPRHLFSFKAVQE